MVTSQTLNGSLRGGLAECSKPLWTANRSYRRAQLVLAQAGDVHGSSAHQNRSQVSVGRGSGGSSSSFPHSTARQSSELRSSAGHTLQASETTTSLHRSLSGEARASAGREQKRAWWRRFQPQAALETCTARAEESASQGGCSLAFSEAADATGLPQEVVYLAGGFTDGPEACPGEEGFQKWWRYQGFRL